MPDIATNAPPKPEKDVMEGRWLHTVFVWVSGADNLPLIIRMVGLLFIWGLSYLIWYLVAADTAQIGAGLLILFSMLDLLLLCRLPKHDISYGGVAAPFLLMIGPRLGVFALAILVAMWQPTAALWIMAILQLLGLIIYLWGTIFEPHALALTTLELTSSYLPSDAPPIKLLQLSDIHLERMTKREMRMLTLIEEAQPDLIVITGDYLNLSYNRDAEAMRQVRDLLAQIHAPHGVFAVLGTPTVDVPDVAPHHFDDSHIRLLRDDVVDLDLGFGRQLTLLGMDCTHDMAYDAYQLATLEKRRNGRNTTVLLYHSPELMPNAKAHEIDLFLCGHTHGGQVRLPIYGAVLTSACTGKQYEMGRYDENDTTLYISRGIGLEGMCAPRIRLLCPPEMTLVTISSNNT